MGNNFSPIAAILYMDFIERQILEKTTTRAWFRFVDDIFFITRDSYDTLLSVANSINPSIQFTLEKPKENTLAYLDLNLNLNQHRKFDYSLFVKPIHSGHMLPYDSFTPYRRKLSLLVSELRRAKRCSSDELNLERSINTVVQRFRMNGYPERMIRESKRIFMSPGRNPRRQNSKDRPIYLKVPFVDERQAAETRKIVQRSGLPISLAFVTEKPLSQLLRKPIPPPCPSICRCENRQLCLKKDIMYNVQCNLCPHNDNYAGESGRTFNRRMMEHTTQQQSHVFRHFRHKHPNTDIPPNISTSILTSGFQDTNHRQAYENNYIRTRKPPINIQLAR